MLQRIGRYEILERIAAGGQGTVYRARDTVLDRVVAVKIINQPVTDDPEYLEALQREARLAASLDHPNVTRVHDFQVEGDTAYIVMEYVPDSLDKHVQAGQPLPYQRAVEIAIQVCRGLAHAHENGVVHRDIKPQNILLTEDGTAKVTDFGIARALVSSTQSRGTRTMGTPWYMALEQWSGSRVDGKADLYSLGILLYEMLTGSLPFQGEAIEAIYVQHRESPVPRLPQSLRIPRAVEEVVRRAMEKSPEGRFPDGNAMATALESTLTGAVAVGPQPIRTFGQEVPDAPSPRPLQEPSPVVADRGPGGRTPNWLTFGSLAAAVVMAAALVVVLVLRDSSGPGEPVVVEKEVIIEKQVIKEVPVVKQVIVEKEVIKEV